MLRSKAAGPRQKAERSAQQALKVRTIGLRLLYNKSIESAHDKKEVRGMLAMLIALLFTFCGIGGTVLGILLLPLLVILECAKRYK